MVKRVVFTPYEICAMTEMPEVLRALAYRHDALAAFGDEYIDVAPVYQHAVDHHRQRAAELRSLATHINECRKAGDAPYEGGSDGDCTGLDASAGRGDPHNPG